MGIMGTILGFGDHRRTGLRVKGIADRQVRRKGCTVDGIGMSEATVDGVDEVAENGYRDRRSLEAELQEIVSEDTRAFMLTWLLGEAPPQGLTGLVPRAAADALSICRKGT